MTTPANNQKTKLPERWDVKGSYLCWDGVAEVQVHCDEISHAHGCRLAKELARRWNAHGDLLDALRKLHDYQNGCPLPKYEKQWTAAMDRAIKLLQEHEREA